jgi:hypothetical protein
VIAPADWAGGFVYTAAVFELGFLWHPDSRDIPGSQVALQRPL